MGFFAIGLISQHHTAGNRNALSFPDGFSHFLIDADSASLHTAAGVRNLQEFHHALNDTVFAAFAVQNQKSAIDSR